MAEITDTSAEQGSRGGGFIKKRSTKIDMTPMVDLAFLLLTFFVLTTTFNKDYVMEVAMPDYEGPSAPVNASNVLNLVLAEDNRIYWWTGISPPVMSTDYSPDGVRQLLLKKKSENGRLVILIKPKDESKFQHMVDLLDEMEITKTKRFAIVEFTEDDRMFLDAQGEAGRSARGDQ